MLPSAPAPLLSCSGPRGGGKPHSTAHGAAGSSGSRGSGRRWRRCWERHTGRECSAQGLKWSGGQKRGWGPLCRLRRMPALLMGVFCTWVLCSPFSQQADFTLVQYRLMAWCYTQQMAAPAAPAPASPQQQALQQPREEDCQNHSQHACRHTNPMHAITHQPHADVRPTTWPDDAQTWPDD